MLKLFSNVSVILEQTHIFKTSVNCRTDCVIVREGRLQEHLKGLLMGAVAEVFWERL